MLIIISTTTYLVLSDFLDYTSVYTSSVFSGDDYNSLVVLPSTEVILLYDGYRVSPSQKVLDVPYEILLLGKEGNSEDVSEYTIDYERALVVILAHYKSLFRAFRNSV